MIQEHSGAPQLTRWQQRRRFEMRKRQRRTHGGKGLRAREGRESFGKEEDSQEAHHFQDIDSFLILLVWRELKTLSADSDNLARMSTEIGFSTSAAYQPLSSPATRRSLTENGPPWAVG